MGGGEDKTKRHQPNGKSSLDATVTPSEANVNLQPNVHIFTDRSALGRDLSSFMAQVAEASSATRGRFCLALSGGSLMDILAPALIASPMRDRIDWSNWHIFWADERWVPLNSPDSNFGLARRLLLSRVDIPRNQIHAADNAKRPDETARAYEEKIRKELQVEAGKYPQFDMILLGVGEDGHTASLFPGHPALLETCRWVVPVLNAPKPPPVRITLTRPVINHARSVAFVVLGAGKANMVRKALAPNGMQPKLPVQLVAPAHGQLHWFIDQAAAKGVQTQAPLTNEKVWLGKKGE